LLAQSVVSEYGGKARFVEQNYGDSELANRFGVTRYPAIFVNDVLVATPKDFGFYGKGEGEGGGRYTPFKSAASHERFRSDLSRFIGLILAGKTDVARAEASPAPTDEVAALPAFRLTDLAGRPLTREALRGRVVLVEFWATWCPPCRSTLGWLGTLRARYGEKIAVLAIAVDSDEANVRQLVRELALPLDWAMATPQVVRAFGDVTAVPTLLLYDRAGAAAAAFYGASPDLHTRTEQKIDALLSAAAG